MEPKEKFLKELHKVLNQSQKSLFTTMSVETRKDALVFRMPAGFTPLDSVWEKIEEVSARTKIKVSKTGLFATLGELDEILGDIHWLWEDWIPRGFVTMIAGDPGVGKSAIAQYIAKIITEGGAFPLQEEPFGEPANVVWVDTEAAQQILKVRADTMKMDKTKIFIPVINGDLLSHANLGTSQDREQIISVIEGTEPDLLVLDSLGGSHTRGENKIEDIRPIMEFLATLARDYQIGVIVVHHLNKERKDESAEVSLGRIRGSTGITGYCRSIFAVEKAGEDIKIRVIKSNLSMIGDPILAKPLLNKDKHFTGFLFKPFVPLPEKKNKKELCAEWILETLTSSKGGSLPLVKLVQQAAEQGYTRPNIYSARNLLEGRVAFTGTGNESFWSIVQEDTEAVKKILSNGKVKHTK